MYLDREYSDGTRFGHYRLHDQSGQILDNIIAADDSESWYIRQIGATAILVRAPIQWRCKPTERQSENEAVAPDPLIGNTVELIDADHPRYRELEHYCLWVEEQLPDGRYGCSVPGTQKDPVAMSTHQLYVTHSASKSDGYQPPTKYYIGRTIR